MRLLALIEAATIRRARALTTLAGFFVRVRRETGKK
jgi:hypothetical protein